MTNTPNTPGNTPPNGSSPTPPGDDRQGNQKKNTKKNAKPRSRVLPAPTTGEAPDKLTEKQEAFCVSYVACGVAARAYRIAYDAEAMAPESVHNEASKLLQHPGIARRIQLLKAELSERSRHSLDTILAEAHDVFTRAMKSRSFKAATDALGLKMRMLGLDKGGPSTVVNVNGEKRQPIDWQAMDLKDLHQIDAMIRKAAERSGVR